MKYKPLPELNKLKELFTYDPLTGVVTSNINTGRRKSGSVVGHKGSEGYLDVQIDHIRFRLHRVIWKLVTGEDPGAMQIDHIDLDPGNNSWENLRLVNKVPNNRKRPPRRWS